MTTFLGFCGLDESKMKSLADKRASVEITAYDNEPD
jgi:hypothetical protein